MDDAGKRLEKTRGLWGARFPMFGRHGSRGEAGGGAGGPGRRSRCAGGRRGGGVIPPAPRLLRSRAGEAGGGFGEGVTRVHAGSVPASRARGRQACAWHKATGPAVRGSAPARAGGRRPCPQTQPHGSSPFPRAGGMLLEESLFRRLRVLRSRGKPGRDQVPLAARQSPRKAGPPASSRPAEPCCLRGGTAVLSASASASASGPGGRRPAIRAAVRLRSSRPPPAGGTRRARRRHGGKRSG